MTKKLKKTLPAGTAYNNCLKEVLTKITAQLKDWETINIDRNI